MLHDWLLSSTSGTTGLLGAGAFVMIFFASGLDFHGARAMLSSLVGLFPLGCFCFASASSSFFLVFPLEAVWSLVHFRPSKLFLCLLI